MRLDAFAATSGEVETALVAGSPAATSGDCCDLPTLLRRCMDDRELAVMLLERFTSRLDTTVRDIGQLLANSKWEEATSAVHSLKGEAGSLAIERLHTTCTCLEESLRQGSYEVTANQFEQVQKSAATCLAGAPAVLERLAQSI